MTRSIRTNAPERVVLPVPAVESSPMYPNIFGDGGGKKIVFSYEYVQKASRFASLHNFVVEQLEIRTIVAEKDGKRRSASFVHSSFRHSSTRSSPVCVSTESHLYLTWHTD